MKEKIGRWILGIAFVLMLVENSISVKAAEESITADTLEKVQLQTEERILEELDFAEIDQSLGKIFPEQKIRFREVLETFLMGEEDQLKETAIQYVSDLFSYEYRNQKKNLVYMLLLAVTAAVFANFSGALKNKQASQISFYVLYMLLITVCLNTFRMAIGGVEHQLELLSEFMKVLCPGYFLAVALASGSSSALIFYQIVLFVIYLVEVFILKFLLPVVHVYIMVQVMNDMLGEETLSEFGELLKKTVLWSLKSLLGLVIGINVIQGLLSPAIDTLKRTTVSKAIEAIPGIGNTFGSMTDVVLGTTVLIKNGIGVVGAALVLGICLLPIVQMVILTFLYKVTAALVQPISDKRITNCIGGVSSGYELILKVLCTVMVLFLLTLAIVTASTS